MYRREARKVWFEEMLYKKIKSIYESLMDDESKGIFQYRMLYSLTNDLSYLDKMLLELYYWKSENILSNDAWKEFFSGLCGGAIKREVIIYGAGYYGKEMYRHITSAKCSVSFFCDRREELYGTLYCEVPVIPVKELIREHGDSILIIAAMGHEKEIYESLTEQGFPADSIVTVKGCPYFDKSVPLRKNQANVFVDAGCYDGATSLEFAKWNPSYQGIMAWEAEKGNAKRCKELFEREALRATLIQAGMWDCCDKLYMSVDGERSGISETEGEESIEVRTLDEVIKNDESGAFDRVGFIKMDIEGAEMKALCGAADTIRTQKPQLAVCVYHKHEDILDILLYIKELNPEYKFYLRHYSLLGMDTVLYAL